jgi:hypothetical protein
LGIKVPKDISLQNSHSLQEEAFNLGNEASIDLSNPINLFKTRKDDIHICTNILITRTQESVPSLPGFGSLCLNSMEESHRDASFASN